jgi:predicted permease
MAWYHRIRNVFRPGRLQSDLERELAFHIRERADDLRQSGMSADEAARAARLQLGNFTTHVERTRDMDISQFFEAFLRNLRYAARSLAKAPAFSATVILTLALGIGANSAVFSAIYAVILRPMPFPEADQLVRLTQIRPKSPEPGIAPVRLEEWNRLNTTLQGITGYYTEDASELSGELPEKLRRAWFAPRFLQVMGIAPAIGRGFSPQEEHFRGPSAVLISDRFWRRRFNADPAAVGKTLRFPEFSMQIIGVMPPTFRFPDREIDLWCVSVPDAPFAQSREAVWFTGIGRLKPGVTLAQARSNLAAVQAGLGRQYQRIDAQIKPNLEPLKEVTVGGARHSLWILFGSVTLLLLIACTNIAALLLSRGAGRQHETAVRFSLGASRASVVAQQLTEVLVLALAGAALGLFVAAAASEVFNTLAKDLPRIDEIALDWRIALYALVCAVLSTLVCGALPAIRGARRSLTVSLARGGRTQVAGRSPVQLVLVGVQVALAVTLLAGAGLLVRSFQELGRVSPGFDPSHVLTFHVSFNWGDTANWTAAKQHTLRIVEGLNTVPGVRSSAAAIGLPGVPSQYVLEFKTTEGRAESEPKLIAQSRSVTAKYFETVSIPLVAGELCRDDPKTTTIMVNRSFADTYFAGAQVIGKHFVLSTGPDATSAEVRGIVGDARETGLDRVPGPAVYWCAAGSQPGTTFLVRTHGDPSRYASAIRAKMREIEPTRSIYDLTPLAGRISDAYAENRLRTILLVFFAATAISLASVGLYGTLSYLVNLRRREVAVRLALGAMREQVARQFLSQGVRVAALGCIAGLALALATTRLLAGMLYGVSPTDGTTLAAVAGLVIAVAALASLLPAVRASRVEPMQALREE